MLAKSGQKTEEIGKKEGLGIAPKPLFTKKPEIKGYLRTKYVRNMNLIQQPFFGAFPKYDGLSRRWFHRNSRWCLQSLP